MEYWKFLWKVSTWYKKLYIYVQTYILWKGLYYGSFGYYSEAVKEEFDDEYYSEEIFQTLNNMSIKRIHGLFNCMLLEVMTRPSKYENRWLGLLCRLNWNAIWRACVSRILKIISMR